MNTKEVQALESYFIANSNKYKGWVHPELQTLYVNAIQDKSEAVLIKWHLAQLTQTARMAQN